MAKVAYGKLGFVKNSQIKTFEYNGQHIDVLQYLPMDDKISMFERIISAAVDENPYYNITKVNFWIDLEIIFTYTNISFTEKQKEDLKKLYDLMKGNGFIQMVKDNMDPEELAEIIETVWDTVKSIYKYANSAMGIMKAITADYNDLNLDTTEMAEKISNPDNLSLIKDIITKLG